MKRYLGRLFGLLIGLAAGPLGALFGLMAGWLIDQFMQGLPSGLHFEAFLREPDRVRHADRSEHYAVAAILAVLVSSGRRVSAEQINAALSGDWPAEQAPHRGLPDAASLLERGLSIRHRVDLERTAAVLRSWSPETRSRLVRLMVEVACADGAGISDAERSIIRQTAWVLELGSGEVEQIELELGGLSRAACDVLGVSPQADETELRRAYRQLAAQFHPDTAGDLSPRQRREMTDAFLRVQTAYEELMGQLRRQRGA